MSDLLKIKATALTGEVVRIIYSDADSGFTIAKLQVQGYGEPITITGPLMSPAPGQTVALKGHWIDHPKFGRQFKVDHIEARIPTSKEGIKAYLGSGQIKGIGPQMAQRIVSRFGKKAIDIIEHHPEKLQ
jgi:exodeoxyribonuclease V alpha subunit